jgi:hypothetical protein
MRIIANIYSHLFVLSFATIRIIIIHQKTGSSKKLPVFENIIAQ